MAGLRGKKKSIALTMSAVLVMTGALLPASRVNANLLILTEDVLFGKEEDPVEVEEYDEPITAEMLNDVFGEVVFYRWERVNRNTYPTDTEWHPTLLVWQNSNGRDDGYIGCVAPNDIYMGPEARPVEGVTNKFSRSDPIYKSQFKDSGQMEESETYYMRLTDRAEGIDVGSDPQVKSYRDIFYTDDSRDCLYVKYGKRDDDNEGLDDNDAPVYMIKMTTAPGVNRDYILEPGGNGGQSWMKIHHNEYGYEWSFMSVKRSGRGDVFRVFYNKESEDDPTLAVGSFKRFMHVRSEDREQDLFKWFIGTKLRYSAIKGDTSVRDGQILSISASNYVDAGGSNESQQGVILPKGRTITVEKGGILSISGDFINNGTIINNGGTILIQKGGTLFPFLQGTNPYEDGCGTLKCNAGDIIVEEGGNLYAGLNCAMTDGTTRAVAPFWLDNNSTLVNYGVVCCGEMRLGSAAVVENRGDGKIYTCLWEEEWGSFTDMLKDNNTKLVTGKTDKLSGLRYFETGTWQAKSTISGVDMYGGIGVISDAIKIPPTVYVTQNGAKNIINPDTDWNSYFITPKRIQMGTLRL